MSYDWTEIDLTMTKEQVEADIILLAASIRPKMKSEPLTLYVGPKALRHMKRLGVELPPDIKAVEALPN